MIKGDVWLFTSLVASATAKVIGWNAPTLAAFRMWAGVAAGYTDLWLAAEAICWHIRHPYQPTAKVEPTMEEDEDR